MKTLEADVGRNLIARRFTFMAACIGLASLGGLNSHVSVAQAETTAAQTTPAVMRRAPAARDAATFEDDKTLNLACRKSRDFNGSAGPETCLCVTHVLKYELSLAEYRAAVKLYGKTTSRDDIYTALNADGISPRDITAAEDAERGLVAASDFGERCIKAKAYYGQ